MRLGRWLATVLAAAAAVAVVVPAAPAGAHPLGNFTVNQHTAVVVAPDAVEVELVVDMAEIPAFQSRRDLDADGDQEVSAGERARYRSRTCTSMGDGVTVDLDGNPVLLRVGESSLTFPPGEAGLPTLRLTCRFHAPLSGAVEGRHLHVTSDNHVGRAGWREMTARGRGLHFASSDVPSRSSTRTLRSYPEDLLASPLDVRHARLTLGAPGAPAAPAMAGISPDGPAGVGAPSRGVDRLTAAFTGLVARQDLTIGFAMLALAAAVALGALHALAPGHGKTVIAAYLVGERGSLRHAATLGMSVTMTHTAGVLVLGLLLSGSSRFVPEQIYPWLGVASGTLLAGVGVWLLVRARRRGAAALAFGHTHGHGHHGHGHGHHSHGRHGREQAPTRRGEHGNIMHADEDHHHGHEHTGRDQQALPLSRRALLTMGAAGGMVPSPSALIVLLGAIALGRTWFGILLVVGYGVGMALTLIAAGLILVRARAALEGHLAPGGRWARLAGALPAVTAAFVILAGLGLATRAVVTV